MAVDFNYNNSIDAGTPAAAAEIQSNFADVLAWIKSYYQQEADTTAEIAAAITAADTSNVIDTAVQTAGATLSLNTLTAIPGMTVSWEAEANRLYRLDVANVNVLLDSTNGQRIGLTVRATGGGTETIVQTTSISNTLWSCVFCMGGSAFLTGLAGTVTYGSYLFRALLVGASGSPTGSLYAPSGGATGFMAVSDLGVAP